MGNLLSQARSLICFAIIYDDAIDDENIINMKCGDGAAGRWLRRDPLRLLLCCVIPGVSLRLGRFIVRVFEGWTENIGHSWDQHKEYKSHHQGKQ